MSNFIEPNRTYQFEVTHSGHGGGGIAPKARARLEKG